MWHDNDAAWNMFDRYASKFVRQAARNNVRIEEPHPQRAADPDAMDVDGVEEEPWSAYQSTDLLNRLHVQVIDHFTERLRKLVERVGGLEVPVKSVKASMHAAPWAKILLEEWSAEACLEYLMERQGLAKEEVWEVRKFLIRPYQKDTPGGRTGQDWPRATWKACEDRLENIGRKYKDEPMLTSVASLRPYSEEIWGRRQRPAGM